MGVASTKLKIVNILGVETISCPSFRQNEQFVEMLASQNIGTSHSSDSTVNNLVETSRC